MTAFIFTLAFIALIAYGLQRNHVRQGSPRIAGSDDAGDRDRSWTLREAFPRISRAGTGRA